MASKAEQVERKLAPVYDLVDSCSWKAALKGVDTVFKKHGDSAHVAALRAYILQNCGKAEEAAAAAAAAAQSVPTDEHVLSLLALTWRALGNGAAIAAAYEAAAAAQPGDLPLAEAVFFAHVREGNLVKQQHAAMRVNRLKPCERHLLWVVTSLLAQAREAGASASAPSPAAAQPLLALAEALLRRASDSSTLCSGAGLALYVEALAGQGKHAESLALVSADPPPPAGSDTQLRPSLGERCLALASDRQRLAAQLAVRCGDWAAARRCNDQLLADNPDDWLAFMRCADAEEKLASDAGAAELAVAALAARLRSAGEAGGGPSKVGRGPWLAGVEAAARVLERAADAEKPAAAEGLARAVAQHWAAFAEQPSCAADLGRYCVALRVHSKAASLLGDALRDEATAEDGEASACRRLRRAACAAALRADAGLFDSHAAGGAAELARARALATEARSLAAPLRAVKDLREGTGGDAAYLLAAEAEALHGMGGGEATEGLLACLLVASEGMAASPFAPHLRLAALSALSLLGGGAAAPPLLAKLAMRHVQHDSMAHYIHPPLLCSASRPAFRSAHTQLRELHASHNGGWEGRKSTRAARLGTGAGDMAVSASVSGQADKALEFSAFAKRLGASHARALTAMEAALGAALGMEEDSVASVTAFPVFCAGDDAATLTRAAACVAEAARGAAGYVGASELQTMRFNYDMRVLPRFHPPPLAGWHSSVYDWWAESTGKGAADRPRHAWPRTVYQPSSVGESARAQAEGGGEAQRARSTAALQLRWTPLRALDATLRLAAACASGGAAAATATRSIATELAELCAIQDAAASACGTCGAPSDATLRAGVTAAAAVAAAVAAESERACMDALACVTHFSEALGQCCAAAAAGLRKGLYPPAAAEAERLPLSGGALNAAACAVNEALGMGCALLSAWAAIPPKAAPKGLRAAVKTAAEALSVFAYALADALATPGGAAAQRTALEVAMQALPGALGVPQDIVAAAAEQLVGAHRESRERLERRARGGGGAAARLAAKLG